MKLICESSCCVLCIWLYYVFKLMRISSSFVFVYLHVFLSGSALRSQGHRLVKTTAEYDNRTAANHEKCIFSVVINKLLVHHDAQLYIPAPLKCFQTVFSLYKEKLIHQ